MAYRARRDKLTAFIALGQVQYCRCNTYLRTVSECAHDSKAGAKPKVFDFSPAGKENPCPLLFQLFQNIYSRFHRFASWCSG